MVQIKSGDIFNSGADIICHQVNCMGVMGAGIAAEIKRRWPQVYTEYRSMCSTNPAPTLLGQCQVCPPVANLFGQYRYGRGSKHTDYDALEKALTELRSYGYDNIAIPYGIGCGLGGGDWAAVSWIIYHVFESYKGTVTIWRKEG